MKIAPFIFVSAGGLALFKARDELFAALLAMSLATIISATRVPCLDFQSHIFIGEVLTIRRFVLRQRATLFNSAEY